jgi:hypothetical protein
MADALMGQRGGAGDGDANGLGVGVVPAAARIEHWRRRTSSLARAPDFCRRRGSLTSGSPFGPSRARVRLRMSSPMRSAAESAEAESELLARFRCCSRVSAFGRA